MKANQRGYQYQREITFDIPVFPGIIDTRLDIKGKVYLATGTTGFLMDPPKAAFSVQALEIVNGAVIEELPQANVWALTNDIITNGKESLPA